MQLCLFQQEDIDTGEKTMIRDDSVVFNKKQRIDHPKKKQPVTRKEICNRNGEMTKNNRPDSVVERVRSLESLSVV